MLKGIQEEGVIDLQKMKHMELKSINAIYLITIKQLMTSLQSLMKMEISLKKSMLLLIIEDL